MTRQKSPNPIDQHVGSRLRMRRMMLDMSQSGLGDALGITFQQVQKYEKGTNRVSSSRLQQACHILQVPIAFFFEGAPAGDTLPGRLPSSDPLTDLMTTRDGLALVRAFMRISNPQVRRRIVNLVEELAEHQD
jgi:transcriptional regulator with XRE-family HTH domain